MKKLILIVALFLFTTFLNAQEETWKMDASHSSVRFSVDYLVLTEVEGRFASVEGTAVTDQYGQLKNLSAKIDAASINTDNSKRDEHLRSDDFFAVEKNPNITFVMKKIEETGANKFAITGDLTMRGVTNSVKLDASFKGYTKDAWGNERMGWTAEGKVNRYDYGLEWNKTVESGALLVGKEVSIKINAQFIKQK